MKMPIVLLLIMVVAHISCHSVEPADIVDDVEPEIEANLKIELDEHTLNEMWLKISISDTLTDNRIKFYRDDSLDKEMRLSGLDTILHYEGLPQSTMYSWKGILLKEDKIVDSTIVNFGTRVFELVENINFRDTLLTGDLPYDSKITDVFVENYNSIWVAGSFEVDEGANKRVTRGYAHWNGADWEFREFRYYNPEFGQDTVSTIILDFDGYKDKLYALSAFNLLEYRNGEFVEIASQAVAFRKFSFIHMEVLSPNDIYMCGSQGLFCHFDGIDFKLIETNNELYLHSISANKETGRVFVCGYTGNFESSTIYEYDGSTLSTLWDVSTDEWGMGKVTALFHKGRFLYVGGDEYFYEYRLDKREEGFRRVGLKFSGHIMDIYGEDEGNILAVSNNGRVYNYNYASWWYTVQNGYYEVYYSVHRKGKRVCVGGINHYYFNPRATMLLGEGS
ncbi:MAG: hypothetical protein SCALA702_01960 [Melioribacteraceae bacterium]|nr:MAG: hypothetical protein SCALA702_01960 [Melioribacteraceae bacterium]